MHRLWLGLLILFFFTAITSGLHCWMEGLGLWYCFLFSVYHLSDHRVWRCCAGWKVSPAIYQPTPPSVCSFVRHSSRLYLCPSSSHPIPFHSILSHPILSHPIPFLMCIFPFVYSTCLSYFLDIPWPGRAVSHPKSYRFQPS